MPKPTTSAPPLRLLSSAQVAERLGKKRRTFLTHYRTGQLEGFPEPVTLTDNSKGLLWRSDQLDAYILALPTHSSSKPSRKPSPSRTPSRTLGRTLQNSRC